jgi:two-component system, OmpR family, sensor kinase
MTHDFHADADHHMRLLIDRVSSMLAYWDRDLLCRYANSAYETWFGVKPDALLGTHVRDLLGPDIFALNEPMMRRALAGERQVFERLIPGPGGVQRHSLAEYIPDMVDGVVHGFMVQVTNVTELKQTQAALRREHELRQQVEAHAEQLHALLQERTEMLDVLAHEVRQPLNNASAALQSARDALRTTMDDRASRHLVRGQAVLGQVLSSIDNTLAVASLLARPDPIHCDDADIDTLVSLAVADMPPGEAYRIEVQRQTSTRTALMDISLMRLALRNLLSNALKFSDPGVGVQVRIADSDTPLGLLIDVSDAGSGIPPEVVPSLFTRGARGKHGPSSQGLGLYIVRHVMALHGGSAELVTTGRMGSTFRLVLAQSELGG